MDLAVRILVLFFAGGLLLLANYWFIRFAYRYVFADELVIAPFQVIGQDDKDGGLGRALARMLEAHLRKVQHDLDAAQKTIVEPLASTTPTQDDQAAAVALVLRRAVEIPTDLLEPINISVSVGGVEVGGIVAWLQRAIVRQRSLNFTVYVNGDKALISGDISALTGAGDAQLWITGSPSAPDQLAEKVSYALIQRKLSEDRASPINSLELDEFRELLEIIFKVADLNRKALRGRLTASEFDPLLPRINELRKKVPQWSELTYLTASIAELAGETAVAYGLYSDLVKGAESVEAKVPRIDPKLVDLARGKVDRLATAVPATVSDAHRAFKEAVSSYAAHVGIALPDLNIVFVAPTMPGILAVWNTEVKPARYEVNRDAIDAPGLAQYVALMGWFLAKKYERCYGGTGTTSKEAAEFWNEFRHSLVGFLIGSDLGADAKATAFAERYILYKQFQAIGRTAALDPTRKLALALLEQYDCDWTAANLTEKARAVNQERNLVPEKTLMEGLAPSASTSTSGRRASNRPSSRRGRR